MSDRRALHELQTVTKTVVNTDHLYPWNRERIKSFEHEHFSDRKLSYTVIENGYILSAIGRPFADGGVFDSERCHVDGTSLHTGFRLDKPILMTQNSVPIAEESIEFCDETVIYIGLMNVRVWGHDLTDELSRFWFLESEVYKEKFRDCRVVCAPMYEKPHDNYLEALDIMGVDRRSIQSVEGVKKYTRIIIPDQSFFVGSDGRRYFTEEYRAMIDRARRYGREHMRSDLPEKLYFTYSKYVKKNGKGCVGERRLEEYFTRQGYTVIAPEDYSFKEQLALLTNCTSFASTIGSCSHNSMFLQDGVEVIRSPERIISWTIRRPSTLCGRRIYITWTAICLFLPTPKDRG